MEGNDANMTLSTLAGLREVTIPIEKLAPISQKLVQKLTSMAREKSKELAALSITMGPSNTIWRLIIED